MDRGVYAIVSGAVGQERRMDVVARNLANAQTVGYKSEKVLFKTFLAKAVVGSPRMKVQGDKVFNRVSGTFLDWKSGTQRATGNATDLTLSGDGFFVVQTPRGPEYTRSGNFLVSDKRQLATLDGLPILGQSGPILIPPGKLLVNGQGDVTVDGAAIDTLKVVNIKDLASSIRVGERYITKGPVVPALTTSIIQGGLEESNVNAVEELVSLIDLSRQYEAAQKVVHAMDDATKQAVNEIGRSV
jgi:flagellar basal-body rod protein FlgF